MRCSHAQGPILWHPFRWCGRRSSWRGRSWEFCGVPVATYWPGASPSLRRAEASYKIVSDHRIQFLSFIFPSFPPLFVFNIQVLRHRLWNKRSCVLTPPTRTLTRQARNCFKNKTEHINNCNQANKLKTQKRILGYAWKFTIWYSWRENSIP